MMTDLRSRLRDAASGVEPTAEALKLVRRRVRRRQLSRQIGTIVVAVLVAAAGTLAAIRAIEPTGRRRPAGPPPSGTLVFLRTDRRQVSFGHDTYIHADPRIMTEDLATGSLGEVSVPAGQVRSPLVSPDGTQIAVSIGTLQGEAASWETGVVNADGTELTTVLGCGVHPCQSFPTAWSPDGRELLAYSTTRPGPALVVLPLDGSRSRPLVPVAEYFGGATWSPDGKTIALSGAARFGAPSISLLDSATGRVERQIEPSGLELISGLAWAPDGRTIAISARTDPGSSSIFIVNVDDGSLRRLTSCSGCQDSAPAWSPDGRYLAFSRGDDFGGDLYLIRPDATGLRRVTTGAEIDCCVSWTTALARPSLKSASPLGFPNGLDAVAFGDASHGWAAGTDGILATTDGGSTWNRQYSGPAGIVDLDALDARTVWAVGRDRLLQTTDGGDSWSLLAEPPGWWLTTVRFLGRDVGFGIGGRMLLHGRELGLFRTTDGGASWTPVLAGPSSLCFADSATGYAAEAHALYKTTDGGVTWTRIYQPPVRPGDLLTMLECPTPDDVWYFVRVGETLMQQEGYLLLRSSDGGIHFEPLVTGPYVPVADESVRSGEGFASSLGPFRAFSGSDAAFLGFCPACDPMYPTITVTTDGGQTFQSNSIPVQAFAGGMWFFDVQRGVVATTDIDGVSRILTTSDGGRTWMTRYSAGSWPTS
jgi:Tol biopolymer transport system component/photosystem II stability/assembly factor-like uncharacterized protein